MGFRFHKSFRLFPGVRLNLSKRGFSTSIGGRGATLNLGPRGPRATVGLPGSGLSYSTNLGGRRRNRPAAQGGQSSNGGCGCGILLLILAAPVISLFLGRSVQEGQPAPAQPETTLETILPTAKVTGSSVNCRTENNASAPVIKTLNQGETVEIAIRNNDGWSKVASGIHACWIKKTLLQD